MKRTIAFHAFAVLAIGLAAFAYLILIGCTTVRQAPAKSAAPSYDGNAQNSGILSETATGGYIITAHFRDRYNALVAIYGRSKLGDGAPIFSPALRKDDGLFAEGDGTWIMDKQHMEDMVTLSDLKRRGAKP